MCAGSVRWKRGGVWKMDTGLWRKRLIDGDGCRRLVEGRRRVKDRRRCVEEVSGIKDAWKMAMLMCAATLYMVRLSISRFDSL